MQVRIRVHTVCQCLQNGLYWSLKVLAAGNPIGLLRLARMLSKSPDTAKGVIAALTTVNGIVATECAQSSCSGSAPSYANSKPKRSNWAFHKKLGKAKPLSHPCMCTNIHGHNHRLTGGLTGYGARAELNRLRQASVRNARHMALNPGVDGPDMVDATGSERNYV